MAIGENPTDPTGGGEYIDPVTGKLIPRGGYGGGGGPVGGESWDDYWARRGNNPSGGEWTFANGAGGASGIDPGMFDHINLNMDPFSSWLQKQGIIPTDPVTNILGGKTTPGGIALGSTYVDPSSAPSWAPWSPSGVVGPEGNFQGVDLSKIGDLFKKPGEPYVAPPDLSFLSQGGGGGGGGGTDFYSWLADQRAREGNPQLQRTFVDWTGYGSGQQPMPPQPTPTPYSAYGGGGGGGGASPPQPASPTTTPPAGGGGILRGMADMIPQSVQNPNQAPSMGGGGIGSATLGAMTPAQATPAGSTTRLPGTPPPPPPPSGGVSPKALEAPEQVPTNPGMYTGGPRTFQPGTGSQPRPVNGGQQAVGAAATAGPGPKFPEVPAQPSGAIRPIGQYANPVFQQQQQTREEQKGLLSRLKSDMEGGAPSLAQILLRKGTDENIAAANALAASGGPGNAAAASRQAALSMAKSNQDYVGQAAAMRAQEYERARGEATGLANQMRVNDLMSTGMSYDNAFKQATLEADQAKTQLGADVQMAGIRGQREQGILDIGMRGSALSSEERMHLADLLMQKYGIDKGAAMQAANRPGVLDYIMKGAATGGAIGGPWGALAGGVIGAGYGATGGR